MRVPAALEITELTKQFPSIDRSLIEGLIEDQGGDVPEVQATLRVSWWGSGCSAVLL